MKNKKDLPEYFNPETGGVFRPLEFFVSREGINGYWTVNAFSRDEAVNYCLRSIPELSGMIAAEFDGEHYSKINFKKN